MSIFQKIKDKLLCPLVFAILQIVLIYSLFFEFFKIRSDYYSSISNDRIGAKIEEKINQCGKNYFIHWIVLDTEAKQSVNGQIFGKYYYEDLIGCNEMNGKSNCAFSVKQQKLNTFYNKEHEIKDPNSLSIFNGMDTGNVLYCDDINECFKNNEAINDIMVNANKRAYSIGLTITKNNINHIVYIFAMTNTNKSNQKCDKKDVTKILEDLAIYAKGNL